MGRRRCGRALPTLQDLPPYDAAADQQHERPEPQQPGRALQWRIVEHEVAVAGDQIIADFGIVAAGQSEFTHLAAQVAGQVGVRIGQRLILADQAAKLRLEILEPRFERR
jgi:hypothetical protein